MSEREDPLSLGVLYPNEYIKASDLKGREVTLTIRGIKGRELVPMGNGKKEPCNLVLFEKTPKKMIANKTNGHAIVLLLCSTTSLREAIGKRITIVEDVDLMGRDEVACIRIIGSPDATPERAAMYDRAWRGERKKGALVSRLKRAIGNAMRGVAPPVAPVDAEPADDAPSVATAPRDEVFDSTDEATQ